MRSKVRCPASARARRGFASCVLITAALPLLASPVRAQSLRGIVSERETYVPVELATVTLLTERLDTLGQTITNAEGYFAFEDLDEGSYFLIASALGYRPVRGDLVAIGDGETRIVEIPLAIRPVPVSGVLVETEGGEPEVPGLAGTGFYDRWSRGEGQFLLPGEVARHPGRFTPQLFREMTFVRLVPSGAGPGNDQILVASHTPRAGINFCEPWIYVDDVLLRLAPNEGLEAAVPRSSVEAVEVYMYPFGPPMRYFRDLSETACGVVLIWTRR